MPEDSSPGRPIRLSVAVFVGIAFVALAGTLYLTLTTDFEEVYVAARDLPAYHQITQDDVRRTMVPESDALGGAVRERDRLLGAYVLDPVGQDVPFHQDRLGPVLDRGAVAGPLVAVPAAAETTMGGALGRGDRVDLLLSDDTQTRLSDVLVVDLVDGPHAAVILRVSEDQKSGLAGVRSGSGPVIVRTAAYSGP